MKSLTSSLAKKREELETRNSVLQKEQSVVDELTTVTIQNRLMEEVFSLSRADAEGITEILNRVEALPPYSARRGALLLRASVTACHIKQKSELLMSAKEGRSLTALELNMRISSTLGMMRLAGVECTLSLPETGELSAQTAGLVYECFSALSQQALKNLPCDFTVLIGISRDETRFVAFYEGDGQGRAAAFELAPALAGRITDAGGEAHTFTEDNTQHLVVTFAGGGADA